jgi:hypothetical protein
VLGRIFGLKRDEIIEVWRKLHNEKLRNLYSTPSIIKMIKSRRIRWAGRTACMGEKRHAYRILLGKPEGKMPLGRLEDNIKIDLRETGWGGLDWFYLAENGAGSCEHDNELLGPVKCWEILE